MSRAEENLRDCEVELAMTNFHLGELKKSRRNKKIILAVAIAAAVGLSFLPANGFAVTGFIIMSIVAVISGGILAFGDEPIDIRKRKVQRIKEEANLNKAKNRYNEEIIKGN